MSKRLQISPSYRVFSVLNHAFLAFVALACLFPLVHVLSLSLSSAVAAASGQVGLFPRDFTLSAYRSILRRAQFLRAFNLSVGRTLLGTAINLFCIITLAYPLSKSNHEFRHRTFFMWSLIFVMLFQGGLVPMYILVHRLGMIDTVWALVLPQSVQIFSVVLMMNFIRQLPESLEQAARIDGASYFQVLLFIVVPLSAPVIATVTLFAAVWHWNEYFLGLIFMNNPRNYPLQTFLYTMVVQRDIQNISDARIMLEVSEKTLKSAQLVVAMIPVIVVYPFLQKFFTKGIVLGAVKG